MKKLVLLSLFFCAPLWAHSEHAADGMKNVGPDKGVTEADQDKGFRLRPPVEVNFALQTVAFSSAKNWKISRKAIIYSREEYQVFRKRDGYWKTVDVSIQKSAKVLSISSPDLKEGDLIAVEGAPFLKIIEQGLFPKDEHAE